MTHIEHPDGRRPVSEPTTPITVGADPELVIRPRLQGLLPAVPATPVTVIVAPAGYGKTVLVSRWAAIKATLPLAWVSFRPSDDGRRAFMRLLAGADALGVRTDALTADWLPPAGRGIGRRFLTALRHELVDAGDVVIVLDALDAPLQVAITSELEQWISTLSPNVRVVVTRRTRPGAALLRRPDAITVLDAADLAFTPDELEAVVTRISDAELDRDQLGALMERTEGWPFGVQVAATAMRGEVDIDTVLRRVHGRDPQIAAMFAAEVLQREPGSVQQFLRRTAVLDTLNAPVCAALADEPRAGAILRMLHRAGAFIELLPGRSEEYRFHSLLRDYLRSQLRAVEPDLERSLVHRATEWNARHGRPELAARYALEADDEDRVIELVDQFARPQFERSDPAPMLRMLDELRVVDRADVALRRAYLLTMMGEIRRAEHVLRDAEGTRSDPGAEAAAEALRATWVFFEATPQRAIAAADAALGLLASTEPEAVPDLLGLTSPAQLESMALGSLGRARWCAGELEAGREELRRVVQGSDVYPPWYVHALSALAILEAWAGNLRAGLAYGREAMEAADRANLLQHAATLDAHLAIALVLLERNDLAGSDRLLSAVEPRLGRFRRPHTVAVFTAVRAMWCLAAGRAERGLATVQALRRSGEPPPPPIVAERLRAVETRLLIRSGEPNRAAAMVESAQPVVGGDLAAAAVQVAVARGELEQAQERLVDWTNRPTDLRSEIEREIWSAVIRLGTDESAEAIRRVADRVLPRAEAQGHRRVFLDAGRPGERVLRAVLRVTPTRYVRELLQVAESELAVTGGAAVGLSERELEILRYLPTDLSSSEIAGRLYISLNTLKTHLRTIYRKLEVGGRREAIERAAALGIA